MKKLNACNIPLKKQSGAVLFVSLVMLVLITILGTTTLSSGMNELKLAKNADQAIESVQNADAGVGATMSLVNSSEDPFNGASNANPFSNFSTTTHPLKNIMHVTVQSTFFNNTSTCIRSTRANSSDKVHCEYYEVMSQDDQTNSGITTTVRQGVSREVIGF